MTKTLHMLIGLPGSGKTYWVANRGFYFNTVVVSTDDIIETIGRQVGMTYNEMFNDITYSFAEKMMYHIAKFNINLGKNIIWDQTNLTVKTRKRKLDMFGPDYRKIAIVFPLPEDHEKRLASRHGKTIPSHVIDGMKKSFHVPTLEEGFDEIIVMGKN